MKMIYKITSKDLYYGTIDAENLPFSVYIHKLQEANLKNRQCSC